jgi:membrane protease YdiL (CAAX protease family)
VRPGTALWLRTGGIVAGSLAVLAALNPSEPPARLPWHAAIAVGIAAGPLLFFAGTRRRPRLPGRRGSLPLLVAKQGFIGIWAVSEEVLWRRVLLGELLTGGALAALGLSSIAFSLAHRVRRRLHFVTGAAFGALYLGTGFLAASIAAHWVYNALVGASLEGPAAHPRVEP